jgi:preprotein translocase subunit SecA
VVLNAKPEYAQREGETIAQAGRRGAVTIATNMAGRGVDIKLGGSAEQLAKQELVKRGVKPEDESYGDELVRLTSELETASEEQANEIRELGGLYIIGTERHESRRIDNQLRGRSGRQGDPGESRFFLSAEDDLIRLFAGERIYKILDRLGPVDEDGNEEALEAKMLTKTIEGAQKKVEEQNFLIRKRVLEYDDVMNEQRRVIYKYRREVLEGKDMSDVAREELAQVVSRMVDVYTPGDVLEDWDLGELQTQVQQLWPSQVDLSALSPETTDREDLRESLVTDALASYDSREQEFGDEVMRQLERAILLQLIDNRWREHLAEMDYLREGIHLRGFAQIDPLVAYKNEGFGMFEALMNSIWEEFARLIFHVEIEVTPGAVPPAEAPAAGPANVEYSGGTQEQPSALAQAAVATTSGADAAAEQIFEGTAQTQGNGSPEPTNPETVVKDEHDKIGRNDPCWCGSGKKYKKCHGA